jgi:hypothetical protein
MEQKLSTGNSPVCGFFPDYRGGATDAAAASDFFAKKFKILDKGRHFIVETHFIGNTDADVLGQMLYIVHRATIDLNLWQLIH